MSINNDINVCLEQEWSTNSSLSSQETVRSTDITAHGSIVHRLASRVTRVTTCVLHVVRFPFLPSSSRSLSLSSFLPILYFFSSSLYPSFFLARRPPADAMTRREAHPSKFRHLFLPFWGPRRSPRPKAGRRPGTAAWYQPGVEEGEK